MPYSLINQVLKIGATKCFMKDEKKLFQNYHQLLTGQVKSTQLQEE